MQDKISIITICLNNEIDIERTVKSVLMQTYPKIEYIIVDGFSKDKTIKKIESIRKKYPKFNIKISSKKDRGISHAMNIGIKKSSGTLICHLHAGDYFIHKNVLLNVMQSFYKFNFAVHKIEFSFIY